MKITIEKEEIEQAIINHVADKLTADIDTSNWTVKVSTTRSPIGMNAEVDISPSEKKDTPVKKVTTLKSVKDEPMKSPTEAEMNRMDDEPAKETTTATQEGEIDEVAAAMAAEKEVPKEEETTSEEDKPKGPSKPKKRKRVFD